MNISLDETIDYFHLLLVKKELLSKSTLKMSGSEFPEIFSKNELFIIVIIQGYFGGYVGRRIKRPIPPTYCCKNVRKEKSREQLFLKNKKPYHMLWLRQVVDTSSIPQPYFCNGNFKAEAYREETKSTAIRLSVASGWHW